MAARDRPIYLVIFLLVLAPIGAAVFVGALLLFGVAPRMVFFVGLSVRSLLDRVGVHAPNSVGVLSTVCFWWIVIVCAGWAWERRPWR